MTTDDLAALLAEHSLWFYGPSKAAFICECSARIGTVGSAPASHLLAAHQAEVIAAAGWVKGRKEWGVRFERDAGPTMDNPSGEVTNTNVMRDEWNARNAVERNVPISARNRRVVRRYVTDWEEA